MSKAKRKGLIFVDWLRNSRGATAVTSWSLRAREGAPVALPDRLDELGASAPPTPSTCAQRARTRSRPTLEGPVKSLAGAVRVEAAFAARLGAARGVGLRSGRALPSACCGGR
jgi:DNA primase